MAFSLFIIFIVVQNRSANTDHLTGAYTRKRLESYLSEKIKGSSVGKTFSAILIDLDNFKAINDNFGHDKGDYVLESIIKYLKNRLGADSFIARFGGDEFFIILDISNQEELELMACELNNWIEELNTLSNEPFKLAISIGYSVYEPNSKMSVADFQKKIDLLMYENKRANKAMITV
jgi:diguanylate cyclase (GGDEF)-like protein